jgi:hypothetical protein
MTYITFIKNEKNNRLDNIIIEIKDEDQPYKFLQMYRRDDNAIFSRAEEDKYPSIPFIGDILVMTMDSYGEENVEISGFEFGSGKDLPQEELQKMYDAIIAEI